MCHNEAIHYTLNYVIYDNQCSNAFITALSTVKTPTKLRTVTDIITALIKLVDKINLSNYNEKLQVFVGSVEIQLWRELHRRRISQR